MTTTSVGSGVASTGDIVTSGNTLEVLSGGSIIGTTVSNGGTDQVDAGGSGTSTVVSSGGNEVVLGHVTSSVLSGGAQTISAGGVADHATVTKGAGSSPGTSVDGTQTILAGGSATYTTVSGSGTQIVMSGGTAYATTAALGGSEIVSNGGIAISTAVKFLGAQTIDSGGSATSTTVSGPATETISNGGSATFTQVSDGGRAVVLTGGALTSATVNGGGFELVSGGSATFTQVSAGGSAVVSAGGVLASATVTSGGTEVISGGTASATVFGFGGRLDLADVAFSSGESAAVGPNDLLTVTSGGLTVYTQQLAGDYTGDTYSVMSDGGAGTEVTFLCFATGTNIRTVRGDVAVEALAIGDMAITASGAERPITWIGHREVDCAAAPVPSEAWPVRVRTGAFGANLPERDLYLSPGHPVLIGSGSNERLVPIMCLINGTTIERVETPSVTYWHVELNQHDVLLAEGLPAESYIDLGSRAWFAGADGALYDPDMAAPGLPGRCRPVAIDGPLVEAERRRLDALFAMRLAAASQWPARESFAFLG